jgi:hypothetical protein
MHDHKVLYDDAELVALQVVREAIKENYSDSGSSRAIWDRVTPYVEKYAADGPEAVNAAILGLVAALGRLTTVHWSVVLSNLCRSKIGSAL